MNIKIKNLTKRFKKIEVLKNVNMSLTDGNIYGFYGRNGSGKSVLLKLIANLYSPSDGTILFNDKAIDFYKANPDIGAIIETPSFFSELSGIDNLILLAKIKNEIQKDDILDILKKVNLYDEKDKKVKEYSLGMKQKLGIAQAIMENQSIILLDEPFNGVDAASVKKIMDLIISMKKDRIIIVTSHIMEDLNKMCDKIFYFDDGIVSEKVSN